MAYYQMGGDKETRRKKRIGKRGVQQTKAFNPADTRKEKKRKPKGSMSSDNVPSKTRTKKVVVKKKTSTSTQPTGQVRAKHEGTPFVYTTKKDPRKK